MSKSLQVITKQKVLEKDFEIYGDFENPLFLAKDIAERIEHSDVSMMLKSIDEDEKLIQTIFVSGQRREMWFLTEDGLYEILMQSRKPIAKQFKKEVKKILKQIRKTGSYNVKPNPDKQKRLEVYEKNVRNRAAKLWLDLAKIANTETYKNIMLSYATKELSGEQIIPLPVAERKTYSATEIGQMFGKSSNLIGRLANEYKLKTDEYGQLYHDKSRYSAKEVESFRYYDTVIPKFEALLGNGGNA